MAANPLSVLGIPGSLRTRSYNRFLLIAARELAPAGAQIVVHELHSLPLYNGDLDTDARRPAGVTALKDEIARADAVLFATPEYNHGVPGVLKNAVDWVSRPAFRSPLAGKPTGIISAAPGAVGGVRAQEQLRSMLTSTLALVMPHRGVVVTRAGQKFDDEGALADEQTRQVLAAYLADLARWTLRLSPAVPHHQ